MNNLIGLFIACLLLMVACNSSKNVAHESDTTKLRDCPEMKVLNLMPVVGDENSEDAIPREYYIYKGKRHEISEFDTLWVKENCKVPTRKVF